MNGPRASNPTTAAAAAPTKKGSDSAAATGQSSSGGKSQYQQDTERDNPEPAAASTKGSVTLSNCQFLTAVDKLLLNEEFEMSVSVKAPADVKNRLATFDLFCTRTRNGKEERTRMWARQNGKIAKEEGESVEVQAKGSLVTPSDYVTGESVKFQLEANHDQASAPEPSKLVEVSLKTQACWVGGDDLFFRTDGELPLLKEDGSLIQVLATVIDRVAKPPQKTPETVICFGYASSAGDAGPNRKLSLRRAQVVKAILERDTGAWDGLAKANFETRDIQQFLSDLHKACGWECDPVMVDGKVHPETTTAIESFQRECNGRYKLGLKEDGVCGPKTWGAVLRVIHGQVQSALGQDPSKEPSWAKPKWGHGGKGVYANGEDFASGGDKPEERSVQITFFSQGSEPKLVDKIDAPATISDNPVHDETKVIRGKLRPRGGGATKPVASEKPAPVATLFQDIKDLEALAIKDGYNLQDRITAFRKIWYDRSIVYKVGVFDLLIPGARSVTLPPSWSKSENKDLYQRVKGAKSIRLNGVMLDISHVFTGADARNHPSAVELGAVRMRSNVEATTWLGDLGSVVVEYIHGTKERDAQTKRTLDLENYFDKAAGKAVFDVADQASDLDGVLCPFPVNKTIQQSLDEYYAQAGQWKNRDKTFLTRVYPTAKAGLQDQVFYAAESYAASKGMLGDLLLINDKPRPGFHIEIPILGRIDEYSLWELYFNNSRWVIDIFEERMRSRAGL